MVNSSAQWWLLNKRRLTAKESHSSVCCLFFLGRYEGVSCVSCVGVPFGVKRRMKN